MDPGDFGSNTLSLENHPESGRQIPPIPEDGMARYVISNRVSCA